MRVKEKIARLERAAERYQEATQAEPDIHISLFGVADEPIIIRSWSQQYWSGRVAKQPGRR